MTNADDRIHGEPMDLDYSSLIAQHAHRGLRWQIFGLFASLGTAVLTTLTARTNPFSAALLIVCGIGFISAARSLRAVGRLLQLVKPPSPKWISWLVPFTFIAGPLTAVVGLRLLFQYWR
jgi:hypothetical protein